MPTQGDEYLQDFAIQFFQLGLPSSFSSLWGSVLGIPAVAVGAVIERMPHRLEESADASSIVPGIKSLIALAVALTTH